MQHISLWASRRLWPRAGGRDIHLLSTAGHRLAICVLVVLAGCQRQPPPASPTSSAAAPRPRSEPPQERLTARELSYRLLPILEQGRPPDWLGPPLLVPAGALGIGARLVVRRPGGDRSPTARELAEVVEAAGPLPQILARNLRRLLPAAEIRGIGHPGGRRFLFVDTALVGTESLLLLPEFWEQCAQVLGTSDLSAALPERNLFTVFRTQDAELWRRFAPRYATLHANGGDPLAPCFVQRRGGALVAGPRFDALARAAGEGK